MFTPTICGFGRGTSHAVDVRLAQADARSMFGGGKRIACVQDLEEMNNV
jgi:hypothetical protein